jgi:putative hydrolase of the HAD superfamily
MIEAIIFDLGDVFLNLNHQASIDAFKKLGLKEWNDDLKAKTILFETGKIDELQFLEAVQTHIPNANLIEIRDAWNAIIGDFPLERLEFLEKHQSHTH